MPLHENAIEIIQYNLKTIADGGRPQFQVIGFFTDFQFQEINEFRQRNNLHFLEKNEILYMGRHHYNSRVVRDGYCIEDLIKQICSSLAATSEVMVAERMTAIQSVILRNDGYGNQVLDRAIFELTSKKPRAELFSVIPKGDDNRPQKRPCACNKHN